MKSGGLGEKILNIIKDPYRKKILSAEKDEIGAAVLRLLEENRLPPEVEAMIRTQIEKQRHETGTQVKETVAEEKNKRVLTAEQKEKLLSTVRERFEYHGKFPKIKEKRRGVRWADVQAKFLANESKLYSLYEMERTGGEPDMYGVDKETGEYIFMDFAHECPLVRKTRAYDEAVRKAAAMGLHLLTEDDYCNLQALGNFDRKSFCWLKTNFMSEMVGMYKRGSRSRDEGVLIYDAEFSPVEEEDGNSRYMSFRGVLRV